MKTVLRLRFLLTTMATLLVACSKPAVDIPDFNSSKVDSSRDGSSNSAAHYSGIYRPFIEGFPSDKEIPGLLARLPYESISLCRTECYGTCPVYEVVFHRDGHAEYHARKFVRQVGEFTGRIYPKDYARSCALVESSHFQDFHERYEASWTDAATCIVTVTQTNGTMKSVSDYGGVGPVQLWAIQQTLEAMKGRIQWQPAK